MLDINLIREKPEWVKEQIAKLNDAPALARIDKILELDKQRRILLTESEQIQAARNKLNKGIGRLRGDKKSEPAARAALAAGVTDALEKGDYERAIQVMEGTVKADGKAGEDPDAAMGDLMTALKGMGDRVEDINKDIA